MEDPTTLYYPEFEPPLDWLKAYLLFHDKIARIVPTDVGNFESDNFKRFQDTFPDAIQDIPSNPDLIDLDDISLHRLDRAFAQIPAEKRGSKRVQMIYDFDLHRGTSLRGYVWLHRSKVSKSVNELLKKYNLAPWYFQSAGSFYYPPEKFMVVKQEASSLILSLLADRIARDNGFDTVTNRPMDFSLLALNGLGANCVSGSVPGGYADKLLANAVITAQIPKTLADVPLDDYREIRKEYSDLREPFRRLIKEELSPERFNTITKAEKLDSFLKQAAQEFSSKVEEAKRKNRLANYKLAAFTVLGLIAVATALPIDTLAAVSLAGVSVVASFVDRIISEPNSSDKDMIRMHRRLVSLKHELASREVSELVPKLL